MSQDNPEQTLDEFVAEMQKDVERFRANWVENHGKTPKQWPMTMRAGDWYDQFLMFLS